MKKLCIRTFILAGLVFILSTVCAAQGFLLALIMILSAFFAMYTALKFVLGENQAGLWDTLYTFIYPQWYRMRMGDYELVPMLVFFAAIGLLFWLLFYSQNTQLSLFYLTGLPLLYLGYNTYTNLDTTFSTTLYIMAVFTVVELIALFIMSHRLGMTMTEFLQAWLNS